MRDRPTESEILTAYALRFAGERSEFRDAPNCERIEALITKATHEGEFPCDLIDQFACLFMLQRYLCKWGGETLPTTALHWRAFRLLFLMTAAQSVPEQHRSPERYGEWEREFSSRTSAHVAFIASNHAQTRYSGSVSRDAEATSQSLLSLYHLEDYLFGNVGHYFRAWNNLSAYDLFCIVIWKANRSKSITAKRLMKICPGQTLDEIANGMGNRLSQASDHRERMRVLLKDYRFKLPTASAILTVLYPDDFTVFDVRACESLGINSKVVDDANSSDFTKVWDAYEEFMKHVAGSHAELIRLRDKDRALWAASFHRDLLDDIQNGFAGPISK